MSQQRNEEGKEKANSPNWTEYDNERNSRQHEPTELKEVDGHFERTDEINWLRNGRHSSNNYSENLEEVDSSILESTHDLQRQISALSDYYSDDEEFADKWTHAKQDEAIAESLAIAENLDRGSSDYVDADSTYESFCQGMEKLRDSFRNILEKWKKRNEESQRDLRGSVSVEDHQRSSSIWNRFADEAMDRTGSPGSDWSALKESLEESTSRLNESLREHKSDLEQHHQMLVTHEHLMQQRNTRNRWISLEYSKTKKLLNVLEKKKIELYTKVNDQEWKSLSDSCDALYAQQPQLRDRCKRLTRDMVVRRKDIQGGVDIIGAAVEGLGRCLSDEIETLKVWSEKEIPKISQVEQVAHQLKRKFDERRTVVTEIECNSYVTKLTDWLRLLEALSSQLQEKWNALSCRAKEILKQKYLDLAEHEDRCFKWKDFSEVDELREEFERHMEAFQEYVPRICQIHERRSPGSTGIFGPKPENIEFNKFYQNYKRKIKAIEGKYSDLESSRMHCSQDIEKYRELYDELFGLREKQRRVDEALREKESMIRMTQERVKEYRDSIHSHLISNQGKRFTDEKHQVIEALRRLEKLLNESNQKFEMSAKSVTATRSMIEDIEKAQILRRHFERMETFAANWEKYKNYEKLFDLISEIENFQAIEKPQRINFEAHEERVNFLEKRLPKICELHKENNSTYLQAWFSCSLEYDESQNESCSFDEMSMQYETWSSDCGRISRVLDTLKKELTGKFQQLRRVDEELSLLSAQGYSLHVLESTNSFTELLDVQFRQLESACQNFRQALADLQPAYDQYFELKTGHHKIMEALAMERCSSDKLTEKLENCGILLTGHRDHLERRRIRIKLETLVALMKEVLFVKAKESENQAKSLEMESKLLINNFVNLSGDYFTKITQFQIPNVQELLIFLENSEHSLKDYEEKLCKCKETVIGEEETVHEYCHSVGLLTTLVTAAGEKAKVFEAHLEAGETVLHACKSFIEGYTNQEGIFTSNLCDSKRRFDAFKEAFNSAENEADNLTKLFRDYCTQFAGDTSGDSFRAKCSAELTDLSTAIGDYLRRLGEAEHCIKTRENEVRKGLEEEKRGKEAIRHNLSTLSTDISNRIELLKRSRLLLDAIQEKKIERESNAIAFKKRLQDENYKVQCKIYQCNPIENNEDFKCPLCSKPTKTREGIILRECSHTFCK